MPALIETTAPIELAPAKTSGLNNLGVPIDTSTQVKKGKRQEFLQTLDTGAIARRYQNIRAILVKTTETDRVFSKLIVQFEVFGDDWRSVGENAGVDFALCQGDEVLHTIPQGKLFLPYCRSWYENQFEHTIPDAVFDLATHLAFIAKADEMQPG